MKKRMFITTIVMMLVLAVALTTSSLAWFSSANTSVVSNEVSFKASTSGNNALNLKVSDTMSAWGNDINLTGNENPSMSALIPVNPLITDEDNLFESAIVATGYTIDNTTTPVNLPRYIWPSTMSFNGAKIGDEGKFIVDNDANAVDQKSNVARNGSAGYYYDYFYIHNSGQSVENEIKSLTFTVESALSAGEGDYTCNAYCAFILYDLASYTVGGTNGNDIPANALRANGDVIANDIAGKTIQTEEVTDDDAQYQVTASGVKVWIPFAGFTFAVDNGNKETAWQFADLTAKNDARTDSLPTQNYDGLSGTGDGTGFVLNTASLRALNNKVQNGAAAIAGSVESNFANGLTGSFVRNTTDNNNPDTTSVFSMKADETYLVAVYFWLDGYTLNNFTDTTVASLQISIAAGN